MLDVIKKNDKINILFSSYRCIDSNNNILKYKYKVNKSIIFNLKSLFFKTNKYSYLSFIKSMNVAGMSMCIKKSLIDKFLGLNLSDVKYHDLFLALYASINDGLYFYNSPLVNYRMHCRNVIGLKSAKGIEENRKEWLLYNINNQMVIKKFLINNNFDLQMVDDIDKIIRFNKQRINNFESKSIIKLIINIFNLRCYPSIFSYFGDINYMFNAVMKK